MARLKVGWNQRGRGRSLDDIGSAISFNIWQIAGQAVLDLENEGFQTDTQSQRLDVLTEFAAFLLQLVDRIVYDQFDLEQRNGIISAAGLHMAGILQDNRLDTDGEGDFRKQFLTVLNQRIGDYSQCQFNQIDGPSFIFYRMLGDHVSAQMGEKDNKWITGYIIDIAGEKLHKSIKRILPGLIDPAKRGLEPEHDHLDISKNYD
ncbi:MAG: hypothetical protein HOM14_11530 [Gammaproteobacteria bacterium]|jgi:hypothetical protein|nr:hypothetical protein [Gammaproteobacteria bacterium]MBT3722236.1 hypothetical protein [Gammaproteobacteria bacterium]MBT4077936.1 hypothetical protein [Gammaproteobacteria bacterium]MBT4193553.1 hypothetical protein [Gammaproteobacteria bacterium]MBT4452214.1 hypothetical protein [Gammaproteobacteria bacterium]